MKLAFGDQVEIHCGYLWNGSLVGLFVELFLLINTHELNSINFYCTTKFQFCVHFNNSNPFLLSSHDSVHIDMSHSVHTLQQPRHSTYPARR